MASELYVETLKGLTSGANANKIVVPAGQTLDAGAGTLIPSSGQIVQIVTNTPSSITYVTYTSTPPTMVEADTSFRTSITPLYDDSILLLNFSCLVGGGNNGNIMGYKFYDITNNSNVGFASLGTGSSRTFVNASYRINDNDSNDRHHLNMTATQVSNSTSARTYGIYVYKESGGTGMMNMTSTDNAGCSYAPSVFTITEIVG